MNSYIIKSFVISLFAIPLLVFAQNQSLPSAGFTPESPFYFLDKLGETMREFFTFNPDAKARVQITFAAERIAEIKVVLETKGVEARGLEVAQSRLQGHLTNIVSILEDEKTEGKDVSSLAKELDDEIDGQKNELKQVFKEYKNALKEKEESLKQKIREARRAGDTTQVDALLLELVAAKAEKEKLEMKKEEHEEALEAEQEKIEREMEDKVEAEKAIQEALEGKLEMVDEAAKEEITISAGSFEKFDRLLAQAKELFVKENYQGAEQLAEQAEKNLEKVEDAIEDLDDAQDNEEDLQEEQEERSKENAEKETKQLKKELEKTEEATKKAEENLRDIEDED